MAQSVEHIVHIDGVTGSSPVATTMSKLGKLLAGLFLFPRFFIIRTDGGSKSPPAVRDPGEFERFEPVATTTNPCSIKLARVFSCLEKMKIFILDRRKRTESITLFTSKNR